MRTDLIFRQLFDTESSTYTYLVADKNSREGILIDPVLEKVNRDKKLIDELGIKLQYILETHVHADHITGADSLRTLTRAKIAVGAATGVTGADVLLKDGQKLTVGGITLTALATPGHTSGCTSYFIPGMIFTGDTLFIRGTGRTDFQQGSPETMFDSITKKIYALPNDTVIFPAHDYNGQTSSTITEERCFNPRVKDEVSKDQFVSLMKNLRLADPKKINEAVPANLKCGKVETTASA